MSTLFEDASLKPRARRRLAKRLLSAGLSIIPILANGTKKPAMPWKEFQTRQPRLPEVESYFAGNSSSGIATVCGKVSGNLEVLDIEQYSTFRKFKRKLIGENAWSILQDAALVRTPGKTEDGGIHIYYRTSFYPLGRQILAQRPDKHGKPEMLIETRSEGNYVVSPGSPAKCHPRNATYRLVRGDLFDIPVIDERDYSILMNAARSFNEVLLPVNREPREVFAGAFQCGNYASEVKRRLLFSSLPDPSDYFSEMLGDLRPTGDGTWASTVCPFHDDNSPSFTVNLETGGFFCFSCDERGGNIIDFHSKMFEMTFREAVADLRNRA